MKVPGGDLAIISPSKLAGYCLNPEHPLGGPKARVFAAAMGFTVRDADRLEAALLAAVRSQEAVLVRRDKYGEHYRVDFQMLGRHGMRTIRSGWTILSSGGAPYLTTAFVLSSSHD